MKDPVEGILLVDKPEGKTSFSLVNVLRRLTSVKKIGHAGTLDPFATGVMVLLIGSRYTRLSDKFLNHDKEYVAEILLGVSTDTFDRDGHITARFDKIPSKEEVEATLALFQGEIEQTPPMFSAKKIKGKKLYELARKGMVVERAPQKVKLAITLIAYTYPTLKIHVSCSKGTYIRTLAHEIGEKLGSGGHLTKLQRTRSGSFTIDQCVDGTQLENIDIRGHLLSHAPVF